MPKSDLVFGSFDTSTSGGKFYKTQPINFPTPEKDVEVYEVPGRSGDLIVDYGSYKNVEITAEIAIQATAPDSFLTLYDALRASIMVQSGYQRLEDSLYPNEYRVARCMGVEMQQADSMRGTATITFDAKPQRYLTSGETAALSITTTTKIPVADLVEGKASDIFNSAFLSTYGGGLSDKDAIWTCYHLNAVSPGDNLDIKLYYHNNPEYSYKYYVDDTVWDDVIPVFSLSGSPLAGGSCSLITGPVKYVPDDYVVEARVAGGADWVVFPRPTRWEIYKNDVLVVARFPDDGTLTLASGVISYSPLIIIGVSGAVDSAQSVVLNTSVISLHTPATVGGNTPATVTEIVIDCDTLNAYFKDGNETYNMNKYVTLDGDFTPPEAPLHVYTDANVDSVDVVPRWWKL